VLERYLEVEVDEDAAVEEQDGPFADAVSRQSPMDFVVSLEAKEMRDCRNTNHTSHLTCILFLTLVDV
jgi:hypothetical protein